MPILRVVEERTKDDFTQTTTTGPSTWDVGTFTPAEIATATKLVTDFVPFAYPADPNTIPALWPVPDRLPALDELDYGHVEPGTVNLVDLLASQTWLKVDRLLWHIANPGLRLHVNPFTTMPTVFVGDVGQVIVDGHHSLAALLLLGATDDVPVWLLPEPE
ncbi:MAG TPA: hypothetical protein VMU14_07905 [Acidimicrobiales bacterium]|nr:hypothetical protein [Acidimicrobiales bacterium]